MDDKIAVKEVPKDLKKLATKVLETEQVAESKVASKAKAAVDSVKKDVKKAADKVNADVSKAADKLDADVSKAAQSVSKESEETIDAAKDTIDLVRSLCCCSCTGPSVPIERKSQCFTCYFVCEQNTMHFGCTVYAIFGGLFVFPPEAANVNCPHSVVEEIVCCPEWSWGPNGHRSQQEGGPGVDLQLEEQEWRVKLLFAVIERSPHQLCVYWQAQDGYMARATVLVVHSSIIEKDWCRFCCTRC